MKSRPILFSGPMVRALLNGTKTQTRRIACPYEVLGEPLIDSVWHGHEYAFFSDNGGSSQSVPYAWINKERGHQVRFPGLPGDRLWVRETWREFYHPNEPAYKPSFAYLATDADQCSGVKWRPSIHMPRAASRITLEIVAVRVERLNEISEADAKAEGLKALSKDGTLVKYGIPDRDGLPGNDDYGWHWKEWERDPRQSFRRLWESLNGPGSWDANPWVWVIESRRVEA